MSLSVVVVSTQSPQLLSETLSGLVPQCQRAHAKIIVARAPTAPAFDELAEFAPGRLVVCERGASIPSIRAAGLRSATGDWVVLTEDNCVPRPDWLARLIARFGADVDVLGGTIGDVLHRGAINAGACFAEYGFYGACRATARPGSAPSITCANVAYRRTVVRDVATWSANGDWDNVLHDRLAAGGARFGGVADAVVDENLEHRLAVFARHRFRHGLDYAARRSSALGTGRRIGLACGSPALPLLLTWRVWRSAGRAAPATFARALPFTIAFFTAWAAGEAAGYLGAGNST